MSELPRSATLYERTQGPNAEPVAILAARAEEGVAAIKRDYLPYLKSKLPEFEALFGEAEQAEEPENRWRRLKDAALDLRGSSATANFDQISAVASSLEWLLGAAKDGDPTILTVVRLHLDTVKYLIDMGAPPVDTQEVQTLLSGLARASNRVTRGD